MTRNGPTLVISQVEAKADSFLVLHPFADGAPVREDYVGATFVPAGASFAVSVRLDDIPADGTPYIIMLHTDVNRDGAFQFGDGVTVPDAPTFEGNRLIAIPMQAPANVAVMPDLIRTSHAEHAAKAAAFRERAPHRSGSDVALARALIHDWLNLAERPDRAVVQSDGLLANGFALNFPSGTIYSREALSEWLSGPASAFEATRHVLHDVGLSPDGTALSMEMEWDGLTKNGGRMSARTRHDWKLVWEEGRPLIQSMDVAIVEPFAPSDWGAL